MAKSNGIKLRKVLIEQIKENLEMRAQWLAQDDLENAEKYDRRLEGQVEVAEIVLCGAIGGFDTKFGQESGQSVVERANHILKQQKRLLK